MPYRNESFAGAARQERTLIHLEAAQRIATMGSWQTDLDDDSRMYWSSETRKITGWRPDEPEPSYEEFLGMLHPDDRQQFQAMRDEALAGHGAYAADVRFIRRDGETRHLHLEAEFERDQTGGPARVIGVVHDVTDTVRLFEQLAAAETARRELLHRLIQSTEDEQARLAHQLHDGPIQQLSATVLQLDHLANDDPSHELSAVTTQMREVIESLRSTLFDLHPTPFGGADLSATLESLATAAVPDLDLGLRSDVDSPISDEVAATIVRISQEALRNVHQHSGATRVELSVRALGDAVRLEIRDDGQGFDPDQHSEPGHLGLVAMRERAEAIGGSLTIESRPGGTTVRAELPSR